MTEVRIAQVRKTKSTYANVRAQIYIGNKVRMSKVRTKMFVRKALLANVCLGRRYVGQKNVCKCSYAKVRLQRYVGV